jgi:hypothetical protein
LQAQQDTNVHCLQSLQTQQTHNFKKSKEQQIQETTQWEKMMWIVQILSENE